MHNYLQYIKNKNLFFFKITDPDSARSVWKSSQLHRNTSLGLQGCGIRSQYVTHLPKFITEEACLEQFGKMPLTLTFIQSGKITLAKETLYTKIVQAFAMHSEHTYFISTVVVDMTELTNILFYSIPNCTLCTIYIGS